MNQETYEALKEIMKWKKLLINSGLPERYIKQIEGWIDEVAKEYTE